MPDNDSHNPAIPAQAEDNTVFHGSKSLSGRTVEWAEEYVEAVLAETPDDELIDARRHLEEHPELLAFHSFAMDLILEDIGRRHNKGEVTDPDEFAARFPDEFHQSILDAIVFRSAGNEAVVPKVDSAFLHFELLDKLGSGGLGHVYLAKNNTLGRLEVLKVCAHETREGRVLAEMNHRGVVQVLGSHRDPNSNYRALSMLYHSRVTLNDFVRTIEPEATDSETERGSETDPVELTSQLPQFADAILEVIHESNADQPFADDHSSPLLSETDSYADAVVKIGLHVAEALEYSHAKDICHGDIKPSNILLTNGGRPMLLDFHLAFRESKMQLGIGGTLPYAAPEQLEVYTAQTRELATYSSATLGARADIFSLGVTLYQMLTGRMPYPEIEAGMSPRQAAEQQLDVRRDHRITPIRELNPSVDQELAKLVESCLRFRPELRPQSAQDVADGLARLLGRTQQLRRVVREPIAVMRRHWIKTTFAAVAVLALGGFAAERSTEELGYDAQRDGNHELAIKLLGQTDQTRKVRYATARSRLEIGQRDRNVALLKMTLQDLETLSEELKAIKNPSGHVLSTMAFNQALLQTITRTSDAELVERTISRARIAGVNPLGNDVNLAYAYLRKDIRDADGRVKAALNRPLAANMPEATQNQTVRHFGRLFSTDDIFGNFDRAFHSLDDLHAATAPTPESVCLEIALCALAADALREDRAMYKERLFSAWKKAIEFGVDPEDIFHHIDQKTSRKLFKDDAAFWDMVRSARPTYRLGYFHAVANPLPDFDQPIELIEDDE